MISILRFHFIDHSKEMSLRKEQRRRKKGCYFMAGKGLEAITLKKVDEIEIEHGRHRFISKRLS